MTFVRHNIGSLIVQPDGLHMSVALVKISVTLTWRKCSMLCYSVIHRSLRLCWHKIEHNRLLKALGIMRV